MESWSPALYPLTVGFGLFAIDPGAATWDSGGNSAFVEDMCEGWFWAGLALLVATLPVALNLLNRVACGGRGSTASSIVPLNVIQLAPCAMCLAGWITVYDIASGDTVAQTLFWLQVASAVLVLLFLPEMLRMTYAPAYSAMTFPPMVSSIAVLKFRALEGHSEAWRDGLTAFFCMTAVPGTLALVYVWVRHVHLATLLARRTAEAAGRGSRSNVRVTA